MSTHKTEGETWRRIKFEASLLKKIFVVSAESNQPRISSEVFNPSSLDVWSEIHYLDSETNYREYLSASDLPAETSSELIMTDDASTSIGNTIVALLIVMFMAFLFIMLLITSFDL